MNRLLLMALGLLAAFPSSASGSEIAFFAIGSDNRAIHTLAGTASITVANETGFEDSGGTAFAIRSQAIGNRLCGDETDRADSYVVVDVDATPWRVVGPLLVRCEGKRIKLLLDDVTDSQALWSKRLAAEPLATASGNAVAEYIAALSLGNTPAVVEAQKVVCEWLNINQLPKKKDGGLARFELPLCTVNGAHFGHALDAAVFGTGKLDPQLWENVAFLSVPEESRRDIIRALLLDDLRKNAGIVPAAIKVVREGATCEASIVTGAQSSSDYSLGKGVRVRCETSVRTRANKVVKVGYEITIDDSHRMASDRYLVLAPENPVNDIENGFVIGYVQKSRKQWQIDLLRREDTQISVPAAYKVRGSEITVTTRGTLAIGAGVKYRLVEAPPCVLVEQVAYWAIERTDSCEMWFTDESRYRSRLLSVSVDGMPLLVDDQSAPLYRLENAECGDFAKAEVLLELRDTEGKTVPACAVR